MKFKSLKAYYSFLGTVCLLIGVWITYAYVYKPLQQARAHEERVEYSIKALFVSPLCIFVGAGVLIMAVINSEDKLKQLAQSNRVLKTSGAPKNKKSTLITILIVLLVFVPPILFYF